MSTFISGTFIRDDLDIATSALVSYIDFLSEKEGFCYASNSALAKKIGFSKSWVSKKIKFLVESGFVIASYDFFFGKTTRTLKICYEKFSEMKNLIEEAQEEKAKMDLLDDFEVERTKYSEMKFLKTVKSFSYKLLRVMMSFLHARTSTGKISYYLTSLENFARFGVKNEADFEDCLANQWQKNNFALVTC